MLPPCWPSSARMWLLSTASSKSRRRCCLLRRSLPNRTDCGRTMLFSWLRVAELHAQRTAAGLPAVTLVSADHELNGAASALGLLIEEPHLHPWQLCACPAPTPWVLHLI